MDGVVTVPIGITLKKALGNEFRLILWDVLETGKSGNVPDDDYSMKR